MRSPVQKVVIVGRDAAAWLAALALQQSFGRGADGIEIELVELPSQLGPQDAYTTLPSQQAFHRLLGLDETRLLRACAGLYSLGQRFSNWSGPDAAFLHAYDTHGISLSHVDFFQYWVKARANGLNVPLEDFSLGAAAAKQGRFVIFNDSTRAYSNATYGYNLDAIPYLRAIGRAALSAGLKHTVGELASVQATDGRIASVTLRDGSTVAGDLFVDASGAEARLLRHLEPGDNFESWSKWLPCDRVLTAMAAKLDPVPAFNQVSAFDNGWIGRFPLMSRTAIVAAWTSEHADPADVLEAVSALAGVRADSKPVIADNCPGIRRQPWVGNVVGIGDSAVSLDALDAARVHLLHTGISWLISMFPVDRDDTREASVYNAKMHAYAVGVRDFQISHFKLNRRFGDRFWDGVRDMPVPGTLERKLRLFSSRGVVAMEEHETFQESNWTAVFAGHRLLPDAWDPQVEKVPEQEQIANFQKMLKFIASEVQAMPSLEAHIELNMPQSASSFMF